MAVTVQGPSELLLEEGQVLFQVLPLLYQVQVEVVLLELGDALLDPVVGLLVGLLFPTLLTRRRVGG